MTSSIRVLVVDDHLVVRRGLATLLLAFNDFVLVGEAQNGAEAIELCATAKPDVVLMDLLMPEVDGVAATRAIRERYPNVQVLVLTSCNEYDLIQRALAAGAAGYLLKNSSTGDLAAGIRVAHMGRPMLAPTSIANMVRSPRAPVLLPPPEPVADLTCREQDVLALMVHGLTNTQIGAHLNISRATVKFHVSGILGKLGAASRTEAAALAVQHQLTSGPDKVSHRASVSR
jgi:two-component system, NarL family, response regulator LiaR